ncbi:MAG: ATP-binding protein [Caulobacterales bacterium]
MFEYLLDLLSSNQLAPHGYCLLWRPELIWTHVFSDALIGTSYVAIAATLALFVRRRSDLAFGWIFWCFAGFILLCGATHLFSIVTLWQPFYGIEALIKLATAIISGVTAVALVRLIPKALALPSPQLLREANDALAREMAERERTEAMLRQAQKIEAVGQLTGGVAHDFNNLLTIISGNIESTARALGSDANERISRYLGNAMKGVDQAKTLTGRLLAFSRRQTLDPKPTDINSLIRDITELMVRSIGEAVDIKTNFSNPIWTVEVDRNQLENALLNLALNARDAMIVGEVATGKLTIETKNQHLDEKHASTYADVAAGDYVVISVSDTGAGMPKDIIEQAPEPFFTTKEVGKGTGLGLSQVFGFMKQSGGHLSIYSEVGQGTTVKLYLPRFLESGAQREPSGTSSAAAAPRANGETVLVVEDDHNVRAYVVELLKELGYAVLEAPGGDNALAYLKSDARIDLLLTDVVMPAMTGRALADAAIGIRPQLPVLFMTGYARNAIEHGGRLDAGVQVITKPFTFAELASKVREVLSAS